MLQRLPIAIAQVKAGNLLRKIRQIVYSLYRAKEVTKKVYNNIPKTVWYIKWILYSSIWKTVKLLFFYSTQVIA